MANTFRLASTLGGALLVAGTFGNAPIVSATEISEPVAQRMTVKFPPPLRERFLENMRDHLLAVSEIQAALADGQFDKAAEIAQNRLGMDAPSSIACKPGMEHMNHFSQFMPEDMIKAGRKMHSAADQFAHKAQTADYRSALSALSQLTQACTGCHAAYKIER